MSSDPTPRAIFELATAFQRSRAFLTAYELGLFTILNDEERTSAEVAAAIASDPRATDRLMNALSALGLLQKHDGRFRNAPVAAANLVKGKPGYMGGSATRTTSGTRGAASRRPCGEAPRMPRRNRSASAATIGCAPSSPPCTRAPGIRPPTSSRF